MALGRSFFRAAQAIIGQDISADPRHLGELLQSIPVGLKLGEFDGSGNFQVMADLAINIMARLYPVVVLSGDSRNCSHAAAIARSINPAIEIAEKPRRAAHTISIGTRGARVGGLFPYSNGWVAGLGSRPKAEGPFNPLAAAFAGGLATAELFKLVMRSSPSLSAKGSIVGTQVSLLDYSRSLGAEEAIDAVDIGETGFVGLGAVGNAAIWVLARIPALSGTAHMIDHQTIELSNLQRYVLTRDSDENAKKTDVAERELSRSGLRVIKHQKQLHVFADDYPESFSIPTLCVSVDNFEDRRVAQALLPKLVVNGYTGNGDLGVSWHRLGQNARRCLACLYRGENAVSDLAKMIERLGLPKERIANLHASGATLMEQDLVVVTAHHGCEPGLLAGWVGKKLSDLYQQITCGSLGMELPARGRREVVPLAHQSVLSGIMLAAELVKRTSPSLEAFSQHAELVQWRDVCDTPPERWVHTSPATSDCICKDEIYREVYREKWGTMGSTINISLKTRGE